MKRIFRKSGAVVILAFALCAILAPLSFAQGGLFDPLDNLKTNVGGTEGVNVVDFSQNRIWGNLPKETQAILINDGYESLQLIIDKYKSPDNKDTDLVSFIANAENGLNGLLDAKGVPNEHGKRLISEIVYQGESQLHAVVLAVVKVLRNLMGSIAIVYIVVSGIMMIFAQGDESKITEQKRSITYAIIGLVVILLIERMISAIFGVPGEERALTASTAALIDVEIYGLISYIKAILGSVAIFMIVLSGIRTVASQGEEEQITTQRKAIVWTIVGLALILINKVVVENIFINPTRVGKDKITQTNVQNILNLFGKVAQYIMGFVGLVAFAALVYGAASLVANYSNDEAVDKAKKIIKNALIGIVIILSAYAIVNTMIMSAG